MTETRYKTIETYDNGGNLIATGQIPYEISDDELEKEAAERVITELSIVDEYSFTIPQVARFLKALTRLRR